MSKEKMDPGISGNLPERDWMAAIRWMAEQIPGGFFVYRADESQELIYVNNICVRIFGCETEAEFAALTGSSFRGLVHPDDYERVQASIDEQIADAANHNLDYVEYRIIRKDGAIRWVDDYGHFAHLAGCGDVYYVFIGDITEKHNALEETRRRSKVYEGMIEQITTMVQAQCRDKGLRFECRIIGKIADNYIGDDMKLKQVIINILSNAIKFTEAPGSVLLTIERVARFENNSTLRFIVRDTGSGWMRTSFPGCLTPSPRRTAAAATNSAAPVWAWPSPGTLWR